MGDKSVWNFVLTRAERRFASLCESFPKYDMPVLNLIFFFFFVFFYYFLTIFKFSEGVFNKPLWVGILWNMEHKLKISLS